MFNEQTIYNSLNENMTCYDLKIHPKYRLFSKEHVKPINLKCSGETVHYKIINIAPKDYSLVLSPDNDKTLKISNGGYFNVVKYENGLSFKMKMQETKKSPSISLSMDLHELASLGFSTDGKSEEEIIKEIENKDNDIIVLEYNGHNKYINVSHLEGEIKYIKIHKKLEAAIIEKALNELLAANFC